MTSKGSDATPIVIATLLRPRGPTGVQTHFSELARYLSDHDAPHAVVTPFSSGGLGRDLTFAVRRPVDPVLPAASVLWYNHFHQRYLERALRAELATLERAVVYCQCPVSAAAALRARRSPAHRVVLAVHFHISQADEWVQKGRIRRDGAAFRTIREHEREVLPLLDGVTFVSASARSAIWHQPPPWVPAVTLPNFVADVPSPDAGGPAAPAGPGADLLSIGTLEPNKNHAFLLDTLAAAKRRGHTYTLDIAGVGPERSRLRRRARSLGIDGQVRLLGYVPDARRLMAGYRAYVHSARRESFGLALVEAMAAGLPVVTAPVGPIPEIVRHPHEARYWSLEDPEAAAQVLIGVMSDEEVRARMGATARRRFLHQFDAAVVCPSLVRFLETGSAETDPGQRVPVEEGPPAVEGAGAGAPLSSRHDEQLTEQAR